MAKTKKVKLKPGFRLVLKIIGVILCIVLGVFLFYLKQINDLKKLGYSELASKNILFSYNKDYVTSIGKNKTLNVVFENIDIYKKDYLDQYRKINYVDQEHFVQNMNKLLDIGYSTNDINIIFSHGNDKSVSEFTKRDKIKYLEEFFSVSYAKLDRYDRYVKYSDETGEDEDFTVLIVNLDLDKEDYKDAVLVDKFSYDMLINKHRYLDEKFEPDDLVDIPIEYASDEYKCNKTALEAYKEMSNAASKEGYNIVINSAYRSYQDQVDISNTYLKAYGQDYVNKYVAKPGYSEHQTGLAFDIGSRSVNVFAKSKEYNWMQDNAYKYGFIHRYTKKLESITGFREEAWHYRYVGKDIAKYIYEHKISLEEYFVEFLDK